MSKLFAINKVLEAFYNKSFDFNEPNKIFTNKGLPESDSNYLVMGDSDNDLLYS